MKESKLRIGTYPTSVISITDLPVKADKAVIEADVPLQYVNAGAEQSLKSGQDKDKMKYLGRIRIRR